MVVAVPDAREDPARHDLLDDALVGLLQLAREDPGLDADTLRDQLAGLSAEQREDLLSSVVDVDRLGANLEQAPDTGLAGPPVERLDDEQVELVNAALDPLARMHGGDEGARRLEALSEDERVHALLDALGP